MNEFKEYLRFNEIEKAHDITSVLDKHNIPYQLDDVSMRFDLFPTNHNPWEKQFILRLRGSDIATAEKCLALELDKEMTEIPYDHYLYSFSDKDIIDVIANQNDWTKAEVKLALQIASDRNIELTHSTIKDAKKSAIENPRLKLTIAGASSWFATIGFFTILNGILRLYNSGIYLPGLTFTDVLNVTSKLMFGETTNIGLIIALAFASVLFVFNSYGKKNNRTVFIAGIILLALDGILTAFTKEWFPIIFRFLALWSLISALTASYKKEASQVQMDSSS